MFEFGTRRMADSPDSNSMWGGRFGGGPAAIMQEINASIPIDKRLWEEDIADSRAHAAMLGAQGIVAAGDAAATHAGLAQLADTIAPQRGWVPPSPPNRPIPGKTRRQTH